MFKLNIFVSSKTDELQEERKRIKSVFSSESFYVFVFEHAGARSESAEEVYKEEVLNCDIYIGIFKEKYSWATEEEYKLAAQNQKEIHIYLAENRKKREPELDRFLQDIGKKHKYQIFKNVENLLEYVWHDVEDLRNRVFKKAKIFKQQSSVNIISDDNDLVIPEIDKSSVFSSSPKIIKRSITDISKPEIESYIKILISSTNNDVKKQVWKHFEELAKNNRLWKHDAIWNLLDKEVLVSSPSEFFNDAVIIIKWILQNAEIDIGPYPNSVALEARQYYLIKFKDLLGSVDIVWDFYHRSDFNQILKYITYEDERCAIWWGAWKKCAKDIKDDDQYRRHTFSLIYELEHSNNKCRDSIRLEKLSMIESIEPPYLAQRAKNINV